MVIIIFIRCGSNTTQGLVAFLSRIPRVHVTPGRGRFLRTLRPDISDHFLLFLFGKSLPPKPKKTPPQFRRRFTSPFRRLEVFRSPWWPKRAPRRWRLRRLERCEGTARWWKGSTWKRYTKQMTDLEYCEETIK